jgi:hypothetical protein
MFECLGGRSTDADVYCRRSADIWVLENENALNDHILTNLDMSVKIEELAYKVARRYLKVYELLLAVVESPEDLLDDA